MAEDTETITKRTAWETVMYWKLAIAKVTGKASLAVVLAIAQALNGVEWSSFTPTQKFCCIALAIASGWAIIDAFLDSTMARLSADSGQDTTVTRRTDTVVQQTTVSAPAGQPVVPPAVPVAIDKPPVAP